MKAPDPLLTLVGYELANLRQARGWSSHYAIAQLRARSGIGMTAATLLHYEHGEDAIPLDRLIELCALYEVPVSVLLAAASRRAGFGEDCCPICRRPT